MTIKLLGPRGNLPDGAIVTLDAATEAALIATGSATADLTGGFVYQPPGSDPGAGPGSLNAAQAEAVQFDSITAAEVVTTVGTILGESRQVSDGDNAGARIIWSATPNNPTPSWRWWAWPDALYEGA